MERLVVTPSELRDVADLMVGAAEGIDQELTTLADALDGLRLQWEGSAQQAFDVAQTTARADLAERGEVLRRIAGLVAEHADVYAEVDHAAARQLGGQG